MSRRRREEVVGESESTASVDSNSEDDDESTHSDDQHEIGHGSWDSTNSNDIQIGTVDNLFAKPDLSQDKVLLTQGMKQGKQTEKSKDPSQVPRSGLFFLHDERGSRGSRKTSGNQRLSSQPTVEGTRWVHDKFDASSQRDIDRKGGRGSRGTRDVSRSKDSRDGDQQSSRNSRKDRRQTANTPKVTKADRHTVVEGTERANDATPESSSAVPGAAVDFSPTKSSPWKQNVAPQSSRTKYNDSITNAVVGGRSSSRSPRKFINHQHRNDSFESPQQAIAQTVRADTIGSNTGVESNDDTESFPRSEIIEVKSQNVGGATLATTSQAIISPNMASMPTMGSLSVDDVRLDAKVTDISEAQSPGAQTSLRAVAKAFKPSFGGLTQSLSSSVVPEENPGKKVSMKGSHRQSDEFRSPSTPNVSGFGLSEVPSLDYFRQDSVPLYDRSSGQRPNMVPVPMPMPMMMHMVMPVPSMDMAAYHGDQLSVGGSMSPPFMAAASGGFSNSNHLSYNLMPYAYPSHQQPQHHQQQHLPYSVNPRSGMLEVSNTSNSGWYQDSASLYPSSQQPWIPSSSNLNNSHNHNHSHSKGFQHSQTPSLDANAKEFSPNISSM